MIIQKFKIKRLCLMLVVISLLTLCAACSDNTQPSSIGGDASPSPTITQSEPTKEAATGSGALTAAEARELLQAWIDDHPFPFGADIDDSYDDALVFEGAEYYTFYVIAERFGLFDVYVHKETGEFFAGGDGEEFSMMPLDLWYGRYVGYADGSVDYEEPAFDRTQFYTGTTLEQLLRYSDNFAYTKVYFTMCEVVQVSEPKLYLAKTDGGYGGYIIIDDRNNSGTNALKGDMVTVYGTFSQNTTVTWTNGSSEQVPVVGVNLLIFNHEKPVPEDFAQALVDTLNTLPDFNGNYGSGKIISGSTVKLLCKAGDNGRLWVIGRGTSGNPVNVDGYRTELKFQDSNNEFDTQYGLESPYVVIPEGYDLKTDDFAWVTGNIVSITPNGAEASWLTVSIKVEGIEPYEVPTGNED